MIDLGSCSILPQFFQSVKNKTIQLNNMNKAFQYLLVAVAAVLSATRTAVVNAKVTTYRATIGGIDGRNVSGFVSIFVDTSTNSRIGYAGIVEGLNRNNDARTCNATNGCGVHIHNGTSCTSTATQGGHYYVKTNTVPVDPWINARYSSDYNGKSNFDGLVNIGTREVDGRVFIGTADSKKDHRRRVFL
jgi:hypothetical protein